MSELPKGWSSKLLGELAETITKGTTPTTVGYSFETEGVPFVKVENIDSNRIQHSSIYQYISDEAHAALSRSAFQAGDVLFSIAGTIGKTALITESDLPCNTNQAIAIIRGTEKALLPLYLKYNLSYRAQEIFMANARGGAMNNVSLGDLKKTIVAIPPLAEQKRIVKKLDEVLAQVDTIKARLDGIPDLLKRFRQSVLASAVSGKLTEEWRGDNEYDEEGYPTSWLRKGLDDLGELARGKSKHRPRNDPRLFGAEYPFIQTGEVAQSNGVITSCSKWYSEFGLEQGKLFPKGTLCITIAANIADTAILGIDACFPDSVVGFTPKSDMTSALFVKYLIDVNKNRLEQFAPATAQKNINLKVLKSLSLPYPNLDEQDEIVRLVEQYFTFADTIEAQVRKAQARVDNLTQSILAKAFRGELVAQDPNDEPADKLLERIAEARKEAEALAKAAKKAEAAKKRAAKASGVSKATENS